MLTLTVNGKLRQHDGPADLPGFLKANGIDSQFVAVAHNGVILDRREFGSVVLRDGDALEIVRPVGGG